jgi:isoprenylcysteine carboxyl methyltransferase
MANNQRKIPIPPPLIFVFCALLMKMLPPVWQFPSSLWLVIVLGGMGCMIGMASVLQFLFAKTTIDPLKIEKTSQLVANGIYQYSRNPMYLGLAFVLLAWNAYLGSLSAILGVMLFVWYITEFQIKREEENLQNIFGDAFTAYCQRTRRWL